MPKRMKDSDTEDIAHTGGDIFRSAAGMAVTMAVTVAMVGTTMAKTVGIVRTAIKDGNMRRERVK